MEHQFVIGSISTRSVCRPADIQDSALGRAARTMVAPALITFSQTFAEPLLCRFVQLTRDDVAESSFRKWLHPKQVRDRYRLRLRATWLWLVLAAIRQIDIVPVHRKIRLSCVYTSIRRHNSRLALHFPRGKGHFLECSRQRKVAGQLLMTKKKKKSCRLLC